MNSILAQTSLLPFKPEFLLYGIGALVVLVFGILAISFGMIYIRALFSGAKVTIPELIALRLRGIPLGLIVDGRITAVKSGLPVSIDDLSTHFLCGGNVQMVVLERSSMETGSPDFTAVMRPSTIKPSGIPRSRSATNSVMVTFAPENRARM